MYIIELSYFLKYKNVIFPINEDNKYKLDIDLDNIIGMVHIKDVISCWNNTG